jgi:hypothetical protein
VTDEILLSLPHDREFFDVAHLVVGGLAARLNLTIEHLEDLQTALESVLPAPGLQGQVTLSLRVDEESVTASVGPFENASLDAEIEGAADGVGLRRVLEAVSDEWHREQHEGGAWVTFTKRRASS